MFVQDEAFKYFPSYSVPYTRILEPKHWHPLNDIKSNQTVIMKETFGSTNSDHHPIFIVPSLENIRLLDQFKELGEMVANVIFTGRLVNPVTTVEQQVDAALRLADKLVLLHHCGPT